MNLLFFLIIILVFSVSIADGTEKGYSKLPISRNELILNEHFEEKIHYYVVDIVEGILKYKYIKLLFTSEKEEESLFNVHISSWSIRPDQDNSEYSIFESGRAIYLHNKFFAKLNRFHIAVISNHKLVFSLKAQLINSITSLSIPDHFNMEIKKNDEYEFEFKNPKSLTDENIMFAVTGSKMESKENLSGEIKYIHINVQKAITLKKIFHNGLGAVITRDDIGTSPGIRFTFSIKSKEDDVVTIELRQLKTNSTFYLYENEPVSLILNNKYSKNLKLVYHGGSLNETQIPDMALWRSYRNKLYAKLITFKGDKESVDERVHTEFHCLHFLSSNEKENTSFVVGIKDDLEYETVQLQFISSKKWSFGNPVVHHIVLGVPLITSILPYKTMYFRMNYHRSKVSLQFFIQVFGGNPILYIYTCKKRFGKCFVHPDDIDMLINNLVIDEVIPSNGFGYSDFNAELSEEETVVAFVYCTSKKGSECSFGLSVKELGSAMYLTKNMRYMKPIASTERDLFSFRLDNKNIDELYIILYTYSGDVSLGIGPSKDKTAPTNVYSVEKKKYIKIQRENLLDEYCISVEGNGKAPAYYKIYFTVFEDRSVKLFEFESGEIITETITQRENLKYFFTYNPLSSLSYPLLITFTALNCKIGVSFKGEEKVADRAQFLITEDMSIMSTFGVKFFNLDSGSTKEDEDCVFYITASDKSHPLSINEGVIHSMTLTKEIPKITYSYDIYYYTNEMVAISFTKFDAKRMTVRYRIGRNDEVEYIISSSRMLILEDKVIEEGCKEEKICTILIKIESTSEVIKETGVNYQIGIVSSRIVPTYLKKGDVRLDGVFGKQTGMKVLFADYIFYYTDLGKNNECEVVIDFKRGSGSAIAYLQKKDEKADKDLSKKKPPEYIPFDYYNKRFAITKEETKKCDNGCELLIGVFSDVKSNYFSFNEYSIFIRDRETVVNLPLNEYAFGALNKTEKDNEYHYYTTMIYQDTDRLVLEFNSDLCIGYVNINSKDLPSKDKFDFVLERNDLFLTIKASDSIIKDGTFLGKAVVVAISTKSLDGKYSSFYSYRVMVPEKEKSNIIEMNTSNNLICKTENSKCFFKVEIYSYHFIEDLYLYAFTENASQDPIEIYANVFKFKEFQKKEENNEIERLLPNEEDYHYSSVNNFDKKKLYFSLKKVDNNDVHVYITIKSPHKGVIKLLSTFLHTPLQTTLKPSFYQMFQLKADSTVEFDVLGNDIYFVETTRVDGVGVLSNSEEEEKVELNGEFNSLAVIMKPNKKSVLKIATESGFTFFVKYIVRTDQGNFDELSYGRVNHVKYLKDNFPITYFIPVEHRIETDLVVTVQINSEYDNSSIQSTEDFVLTGVITNENYILSRKKMLEENPIIEVYGSVSYNKDLRLGRFFFTKKEILDCEDGIKKYFFVQIKQDVSNMYKYQKVVLDVLATPISDKQVNVPINQYFYTKINLENEITSVKLRKSEKNHNFMRVEFSINSTDFELEISKEKEKNITHLKEIDSFGKKIFEISELGDSDYVNINLIPQREKVNSASNPNLMIKYRTSEKEISGYEIKDNDGTFIVENEGKKMFIGKARPILNKNQESIQKAKYRLRLFEYSKYQSEKALDSLSNTDIPYRSFTGKLDDEKREIVFEVKDFPKGEYYINIVGTVVEEPKEQFLYRTQYIKIGDNGINSGRERINWIALICAIAIVILVAVILFMHRLIVKVRSNLKSDKIEYSQMR